jgi:hypothetical protein
MIPGIATLITPRRREEKGESVAIAIDHRMNRPVWCIASKNLGVLDARARSSTDTRMISV